MLEYTEGRHIDMGSQIIESNDLNIKYETLFNLTNLAPSYDKKFDTFYISSLKPGPAVSVDWDGELWIRVASNGEIIGIEVENFERVFLYKYPEVAKTWKEFKRVCLKNERQIRKPEVCESFLLVLLTFLSGLFKTHPQQPLLMPV
jgi:uncharacterized protein YuzE